jgi:hypothetical protein
MHGSQQGWVTNALILTFVTGPLFVGWTPHAEAACFGAENTCFGVDALDRNTAGTANIANGTWQNTAIGLLALAGDQSPMTGSYNVGVGAFSLLRNTTGYLNVAIGPRSLARNTTGKRNVAVGSSTLFGAGAPEGLTGSDNTAIGYAALLADTTGYANVAQGAAATTSSSAAAIAVTPTTTG